MRVAQSGPYVMVKKFGIEGLLMVDPEVKDKVLIESNPEKEEATVVFKDGSREPYVMKVFDSVKVEIRAQMVEYRRSV